MKITLLASVLTATLTSVSAFPLASMFSDPFLCDDDSVPGTAFIPATHDLTRNIGFICEYAMNNTISGSLPGPDFNREYAEWTGYNTSLIYSISHIPGGVEKFVPRRVCKEQFKKVVKDCSHFKVGNKKGLFGGCVNSDKYGFQACLTTATFGYTYNSTKH